MQKARGQPLPLRVIGLPQLASIRFQVLFHSHSWVLFNFPSRYLCTIGCQLVFSLGQWSGRIPTRFLVSGGTWGHRYPDRARFVYGTITRYGRSFQSVRLHDDFVTGPPTCMSTSRRPTTPAKQPMQGISLTGLGYSLFARRYLGNFFGFSSSGY